MSAHSDFVRELESVPWFSSVGCPIDDQSVKRIRSFDEWAGPEDPLVERIHLDQQRLYDDLFSSSPAARAAFDALAAAVLRDIAMRTGFDTARDAWDARSSASWHAAWTASLIATFLQMDEEVPSLLVQQWAWFKRGHWPNAYAALDVAGTPVGFVVL